MITKGGNWLVEGAEVSVMAQAEKAVEAVVEDLETGGRERMMPWWAMWDETHHFRDALRRRVEPPRVFRLTETETEAVKEAGLLHDLLGCGATTGIALQLHDSILVESRAPTQEEIDEIREQFKAEEPEWALDWGATQERWKQAMQPRRMQSRWPNEPATQNIPLPPMQTSVSLAIQLRQRREYIQLRDEVWLHRLGEMLSSALLHDMENWKDDPSHPPVAPEVETQHRLDIAVATERCEAIFARLNNEYDNLKTDK